MGMAESSLKVVPGAEAYTADGGPSGVLLIHGFTGSPASMTPWAQYLEKLGHTVRVPRLPGHGTTWQELNTMRWPDWYGEAETAYRELRERCESVAICALSMGGAVGLRLAEKYPVDALVLVNPYIVPKIDQRLTEFLHWVLPSVKGIENDIKKPGGDEVGYLRVPLHAHASLVKFLRMVRADLAEVTAPTLLFRATDDHVVSPGGRDLIMKTLPNVEFVELADSYHVATLDNDAERIFAASATFIERHGAAQRDDHA